VIACADAADASTDRAIPRSERQRLERLRRRSAACRPHLWSVTSAWKHKIEDAVSALIVRWDGGRVGVSYTFADGAREAHAVGTDDWPTIKRLKAAGKLSYADDEVRAGMDEIERRGLDRG
jgi:hypothetical protein